MKKLLLLLLFPTIIFSQISVKTDTENNNIVVNENMETTVPGLFACGDCTGGLLQISKAIYEGTKAGLAVLK